MNTLDFLRLIMISAAVLAACNNPDRRTAGDSVEQARDVNDTTAMVNEPDAAFAVKAADAGLAEIELGRLAVDKADDPRVKDFAKKMVTDHEKANDELLTIATKHNITLPPVVSKDHADNQRKLRERSGADFEREFMDVMVKDHNQVVSMFEDASTDARNADLQAFAAKTLPVLKKHHEEAKAIQDSINPMDTTTIQRVMP